VDVVWIGSLAHTLAFAIEHDNYPDAGSILIMPNRLYQFVSRHGRSPLVQFA
jgi:hypothetical protein